MDNEESTLYMEDEIPHYSSNAEELNELMNFYKFSYQPSSKYKGTGIFELLLDENDIKNKTEDRYFRIIRCDPEFGVQIYDDLSSITDTSEISFHVIMPFNTFHNVFWGIEPARTFVFSNACKVKNWAYSNLYSFSAAFDFSTANWKKYYLYKRQLIAEEREHEMEFGDYQLLSNESIMDMDCIDGKFEHLNDLVSKENVFSFNSLMENMEYCNYLSNDTINKINECAQFPFSFQNSDLDGNVRNNERLFGNSDFGKEHLSAIVMKFNSFTETSDDYYSFYSRNYMILAKNLKKYALKDVMYGLKDVMNEFLNDQIKKKNYCLDNETSNFNFLMHLS